MTDPASAPKQGDEGAPDAWLAPAPPTGPTPIGLHRVEVLAIDGSRIRVSNLEAVNGTPILDLKPVLSGDVGER